MCLNLQLGNTSSKVVRLRYHITFAKVLHLLDNLKWALDHWIQALHVITMFQPQIGVTTRIVYASVRAILRHQNTLPEVVQRSQEEVAYFDKEVISKLLVLLLLLY